MKKVLSILWIIILIGSVIIAITVSKPNTEPEILPVTNENTDPQVVIKDTPVLDNEISDLNYSELIADGDKKFAEGYTLRAIQNYKKAAQLNPNSSDPLMKLGNAYLKDGQPEQAKGTFEQAIKLNPNSIEARLALAEAYFGLKKPDEAQKIILSLNQENAQVKYYRAIIYVLAKDFEQAKKLFEQIPGNDSQKFLDAFKNFSYYKESDPIFLQLMLAKALTEVKEYNAAIPYLFDILNVKNDYRDAWIVLGYAYLNTNKIKDSIDALLQAKALNPDQPQTLFYLGLAYFADNDVDTAIKYLEAAEKAGYEPVDQLKLKLGDLYLIQQEYEKSANNYLELLSINQNNMEVFTKSIWLAIEKLNKPEKALEIALTALKEHPEEAMSYNLVGWAYTANNDFEKGKVYLEKALAMNSDFDAANLNFGWLYEKKGTDKLAKEYYKRAYTLGNGNSIGNLAAIRFNKITEKELANYKTTNL